MTEIKPYFRTDRGRGFIDPNAEFGPGELYGWTPYTLGIYYRMRRTYDTIVGALNERHRQMRRITYEVRPRDPEPTEAQRQAAELVGSVLTTMQHMPLSRLVADVDDRCASFGHALGALNTTGDTLGITWIEPYAIREFLACAYGRELVGVRYDTGFGYAVVPASQLVWFGRMAEAGNFWGVAELRGILADFVSYDQELRTHLSERIVQAGTVYLQEGESGASSAQVEAGVQWLDALLRGERAPASFPHGYTPAVLNAPSGSGGNTQAMLQFYDTKVREYLGTMLGSLGISGVGARSLGETFEVADRDKFLSHADDVCTVVSGTDNANVQLIRRVGEWLGIDPGDDPVIAVAERPAKSAEGRAATFVSLVTSGVYPSDRVTEEQRREIIAGDLGLPYPDTEDVAASGDGLIDADGVASLYYPPEAVMDAAAAGKARRLEVPRDDRPKTWPADVATATRLADGDGFRAGEVRELAARINAIDPTAPGADIRRDMLGGDGVAAWLSEVANV